MLEPALATKKLVYSAPARVKCIKNVCSSNSENKYFVECFQETFRGKAEPQMVCGWNARGADGHNDNGDGRKSAESCACTGISNKIGGQNVDCGPEPRQPIAALPVSVLNSRKPEAGYGRFKRIAYTARFSSYRVTATTYCNKSKKYLMLGCDALSKTGKAV